MTKPKPRHKTAERQRKARESRILRLVAKGYTYEQIGAMLTPKITRQRVGAIVAAAEVE